MPDPITDPPTGYWSLARDGMFREGELRLPGHPHPYRVVCRPGDDETLICAVTTVVGYERGGGTLKPVWNGRNRLDRFDGEIEIEGLTWTATLGTPMMGRGTLTLTCPPTRYPEELEPK